MISRSVLAWMTLAGWEVSPLVELFLVALLFGCGTDFCLFVSWRFGEHWDADDPARAMRVALERSSATLLTSAGTVIVGLSLMGTTRFKLFSSTGPSVAIGLAITLAATLTLTPALLVMLARLRPRAFTGLSAPLVGVVGMYRPAALARPIVSWLVTVLIMAPLAVLGLRSSFVQDVMTEMPSDTTSVKNLRWLATKFDAGSLAPLTVVLDSDSDLRSSEGLALIDDVSRFLARQRRILEVRSATQPLGSTAPLDPARLSERLRVVNAGPIADGVGVAPAPEGVERGGGQAPRGAVARRADRDTADRIARTQPRAALASNLRQAWGALLAGRGTSPRPAGRRSRSNDPRNVLVLELTRAADGAGRIAAGAAQARHEVSSILDESRWPPGTEPAHDHRRKPSATIPSYAGASVPISHPTDTAPGSI